MDVLRVLLLLALCTSNTVLSAQYPYHRSSVTRPHNRINPLLVTDRLDKNERGDVLNSVTVRERPHRHNKASKRATNLDLDLDEYIHAVPASDAKHFNIDEDYDVQQELQDHIVTSKKYGVRVASDYDDVDDKENEDLMRETNAGLDDTDDNDNVEFDELEDEDLEEDEGDEEALEKVFEEYEPEKHGKEEIKRKIHEKQDSHEIGELQEEAYEEEELEQKDQEENEAEYEGKRTNQIALQSDKQPEQYEEEVYVQGENAEEYEQDEEEEYEEDIDDHELEDEEEIEKTIQKLQALLEKKRGQGQTEESLNENVDDYSYDDDVDYVVELAFDDMEPDTFTSTMASEKQGYGIVFVGNVQQLSSIYVSIAAMQWQSITEFPIEVFLYGANDVDDTNKCQQTMQLFANDLDIACKYILIDIAVEPKTTEYTYFAIALLRSEFQHVLFLDAHSIVVNNPQILFASKAYQERSAIFWPSVYGKKCDGVFDEQPLLYGACLSDSGIYQVLDTQFIAYNTTDLRYTQSQTARQMVVDTLQYSDLLQSVLQCTHSDQYQQFIHGADCFKFMWMEHGTGNFYFVPIMPEFAGFVSKKENNGYFFNKKALLQFWSTNKNVMFIDGTQWQQQQQQLLDSEHSQWKYFMHVREAWQCPVFNGQSEVFPFPNDEQYIITKVKTRKKVNGNVVDLLASKCIGFLQNYYET